MQNIRTDMANELRENLGKELDGIAVEDSKDKNGIAVSRIEIQTNQAEKILGKPIGTYTTIELQKLHHFPLRVRGLFARKIAGEIAEFLPQKRFSALVVGLGNRRITPDALGPQVCDRVFVTRHIKEHIPDAIDKRASTVSVVIPGVLGETGIDTGDVVRGVIERIDPDVIVAVDALSARKTERLGACVQITDTGIQPGSGLGNRTIALNEKTMGRKVIGIGVPLVAHASTIACDLVQSSLSQMVEGENLEAFLNSLSMTETDLFVTPKEIDLLVRNMARILATALNDALNPCIPRDEIREYMN